MLSISLSYLKQPGALFSHLAEELGAIWFHGGQTQGAQNRWEWFSAWPSEQFRYQGSGNVLVTGQKGTRLHQCDDFFAFLPYQHRFCSPGDWPFVGGLAGHFNYELGFECLGLKSRHRTLADLATVGRYDWCVMTDHQNQQSWLLIQDDCPSNIAERARSLLDFSVEQAEPKEAPVQLNWRSLMGPSEYEQRFSKLQQHLRSGDIYQANLTRSWLAQVDESISDWRLYRQVIDEISAPFSVYHKAADHSLLSVSPERFLTIDQRHIMTQPIKGTRPRSPDAQQDALWSSELLASAKDRAENVMIVDLLRNDLSRNARPGSVKVAELFKLESYSNVHHLVSTITAEMNAGVTPLAVLRDAFPGGSITGAPKRRAMQIIDRLELGARGPYCGSAFWLSDNGQFNSNILIRSLVRHGNQLTCQAGGGVVVDSECQAEYAEGATKVEQLLHTLGAIEGV